MTTIVLQSSMFGPPVVSGTISKRLEYLLAEHPEARDDYMVLLVLFWVEFDGLAEVLGDKTDAFKEWFVRSATSPKTIQNRCMEVQNAQADLEASSPVAAQRLRQATQGPVNHSQ